MLTESSILRHNFKLSHTHIAICVQWQHFKRQYVFIHIHKRKKKKKKQPIFRLEMNFQISPSRIHVVLKEFFRSRGFHCTILLFKHALHFTVKMHQGNNEEVYIHKVPIMFCNGTLHRNELPKIILYGATKVPWTRETQPCAVLVIDLQTAVPVRAIKDFKLFLQNIKSL